MGFIYYHHALRGAWKTDVLGIPNPYKEIVWLFGRLLSKVSHKRAINASEDVVFDLRITPKMHLSPSKGRLSSRSVIFRFQ